MAKKIISKKKDNDATKQKKKNMSKLKDIPRILVGELRKRVKKGIKNIGIRKTLKIDKVKNGQFKLQNYQFIQIFLNIKSSRLGYQVLKLLTKPGYAKKFKQNCKKTPFFKKDTIWIFFIKAYLVLRKLGKHQIEKQRQFMRQCINQYAGDFSNKKTPGNQRRQRSLQGDLDLLQKQYSKILNQIQDNQQQNSQEYYYILQQAQQLGLCDQLKSHLTGINTSNNMTMLEGDTSMPIDRKIDSRLVSSLAESQSQLLQIQMRSNSQAQFDRKSLRKFKKLSILRLGQSDSDNLSQQNAFNQWSNQKMFDEPKQKIHSINANFNSDYFSQEQQ